ncbi:MAG: GIY-YIG nuclease family protein [Thermomicrobiales bacterium]|nr:GIY-YIG nuclease family protein [Thermomicrobiales bacterium]
MVQYSAPPSGSTAPEDESPAGAFQFLLERAIAYVHQHDGAVAEELLIRHVFGASTSPAVWTSLFQTVVSQSSELRRRGDGQWTLTTLPVSGSLLLEDFVALDVETTGLKPTAHRVIEIGMVRFQSGCEAGRYSQLVQPGRKLPQYITKLTGIRDDDLQSAPAFDEVAAEVEEFIGSGMIVGHNVEFDVRFISEELKRSGRQALINERLDTMSLGLSLLPNIRRPSLDKIASQLGMSPRKLHRALDDAELTSRCALLLLEIARDKGIGSLEELRASAQRTPSRPREGVGRARAMIDASHLEQIPRCPGVYLMRDAADRIIYVGKAKNLRERVSSYYNQPLGYTRKMDGLAEAIARIDVERTGTELEALILEAQLIRRYQPRYNSALKAHEQYPYIRVTMSSPWPRICLAQKPADNGDRYFGPFQNRTAAKRAVDLLNSVLPLRTCPRSFKSATSLGSPCLRLDLKQCLGPCVGQANRGAYLEAIGTALRFLEGRDDALIDEMHRQLEDAAATQDFETARQLRNGINTLTAISRTSRRIASDAFARHKVILLPAFDDRTVTVAIVATGRIWASVTAEVNDKPSALAERLDLAHQRLLDHGDPVLDRTTIDDTAVVSRWIEKNEGHPGLCRQPEHGAWDWMEIAKRALDLTHAEFVEWNPPDDGNDIVIEITPNRPTDSASERDDDDRLIAIEAIRPMPPEASADV